MPKIIALCGISGVGKTHRRTTDPKLKDLPYVDVADVYAMQGDIRPQLAFHLMLDDLEAEIEEGHEEIVAEAYFAPRGWQRLWLEHLAEKHDYQVEYIELAAPVEVCIERIQKAREEDQAKDLTQEQHEILERYHAARLHILAGLEARGQA